MTKVTKEMINAAHDVTMKSKLMLGHELLEKIYLAMDSQRTWVGLTDEDRKNIFLKWYGKHWAYTEQVQSVMNSVEAKLQEKNQ